MTTQRHNSSDTGGQNQQQGRTDDLLSPGAEAQDGARGFEGAPEQLRTGMENMTRQTGTTQQGGNRQSTDNAAGPASQAGQPKD